MSKTPPDRGSPPGTPRWVKMFAIGFIVLVLLFVILHLIGLGFGDHGLSSQTLFIEQAVLQL
ncbi:MAG TPA: hypothetical protein VFZ43_03430 [Anaerolineales bacterium]